MEGLVPLIACLNDFLYFYLKIRPMIDETERMTKREYRILLVTIIGLLIFGLIAMLLVMTA